MWSRGLGPPRPKPGWAFQIPCCFDFQAYHLQVDQTFGIHWMARDVALDYLVKELLLEMRLALVASKVSTLFVTSPLALCGLRGSCLSGPVPAVSSVGWPPLTSLARISLCPFPPLRGVLVVIVRVPLAHRLLAYSGSSSIGFQFGDGCFQRLPAFLADVVDHSMHEENDK